MLLCNLILQNHFRSFLESKCEWFVDWVSKSNKLCSWLSMRNWKLYKSIRKLDERNCKWFMHFLFQFLWQEKSRVFDDSFYERFCWKWCFTSSEIFTQEIFNLCIKAEMSKGFSQSHLFFSTDRGHFNIYGRTRRLSRPCLRWRDGVGQDNR